MDIASCQRHGLLPRVATQTASNIYLAKSEQTMPVVHETWLTLVDDDRLCKDRRLDRSQSHQDGETCPGRSVAIEGWLLAEARGVVNRGLAEEANKGRGGC